MSYRDPGARDLIDRMTIRMPYVSDERRLSVESWPVVAPRAPLWLRRRAEQIGRQFHRETHVDFPPYLAEDSDGQDVVLLPSRCLIWGGQLLAGAVGIADAATAPRLEWAYVHPYERGRGLVERAWPDVMCRYPSIRLNRAPANTPAGNALLGRLLELTSGHRG